MKKLGVLTAMLLLCVCSAWAQMTLSGKVVDAKTGRALIGATVRLEQTTIGSATDAKGEFVLRNKKEGEYRVRASYTGYTPVVEKVAESREGMIFKLQAAPVGLDQVVVTGTGTHRKLKDSPVPVEVITAAEIRKAGVTTMEDALLILSPSFNIRPTVMGSYFTLNGLSNKYILILVDGKKLAGDVSDNTDLSRIDMGRVKRIEILKGAASSLYGSEAMAGVVNIITEQPHDKLNAVSNTRFGGNGSFVQNLSADVNAGKFTSSTSYQRQQADGWQLNSKEMDGDKLVETGKEASNKYHSNIVSQKFSFAPSKKLDFYAQGSYFDKSVIRPTPAYTYDFDYLDYNFAVGAKYLLGNSSYLDLDVYTDNYEYSKIYTVESKTNKIGDKELDKRQRYTNANLKGVFKVGQYNKLTGGLEYLTDYMKRPGDLAEPKSAYTMSFYAQDEIRLWKNLQLIPGFRYVYHETFKSRFTPKLAAMYTLGDFNIRAAYASGFKAPNLRELYYDYESRGSITVGDPDLKPETSNYYSVNFEYAGHWLNASVSGYINDVDNIIVKKAQKLTEEDKANGIKKRYIYANISESRIQGFEVALNSFLGAGFSVGASYNFADAKDRKEDLRLEETVRHAASVRASWGHEWGKYRLNANVNGRIQGKKYFLDADGNDDSAVKYNMWNLSTNHSFGAVGNFLFDVNLGIENLFDYVDNRPYGVKYATLSPGRTFFAGVVIRFKK